FSPAGPEPITIKSNFSGIAGCPRWKIVAGVNRIVHSRAWDCLMRMGEESLLSARPVAFARQAGISKNMRRGFVAVSVFALFAWRCLLADFDSAPGAARTSDGESFTGTRSCVSAGCHGSVVPHSDRHVLQNEYTTWIGEDVHARAYEKLFGAAAVQIVEGLGEKSRAHENRLCLACHTNPLAVSSTAAAGQE